MAQKVIAYKPIALDGGYGWIVVLGSFLIHVFADGFVYSFGVIAESLIREFDVSNAEVSTILSLLTGLMLAAGPVASAICNRIGCRTTTIIGAIIASIGCAISYKATSMKYLLLSVGIIMGSGFGLMYCPAIVIVTMYFERYRSLATGITVCGAGVGTFVFSKIIGILIINFDWRTVFLIYAALVLLCVPCGALYRPIEFAPIYEDEDDAEEEENLNVSKLENYLTLSEENETSHLMNEKSNLQNNVSGIHKKHIISPEIIPEEENSSTDAEDSGANPKMKVESHGEGIRPSISQLLLSIDIKPTGNDVLQRFRSLGEHLHIRSNGALYSSQRRNRRTNTSTGNDTKNTISISTGYLNIKDVFYHRSVTALNDYAKNQQRFRSITSLQSHKDFKDSQNRSTNIIRSPSDITESKFIRPIKSHNDKVEKPGNNIVIESSKDIVECESMTNSVKAIEIWRTIKRLMDLSLLVDPVYLLFAISNFLTSIGFNAPPMFMPMNAEMVLGFSKADAASTVSAYGLANLCGRIAFGLLCDRKLPFSWGRDCVRNRLWIYNCTLMLCGFASSFVFTIQSFPFYITYCFFFGFTISSYVSLTSVVLVDLIGIDRLTNAFGLLLFIQGIATFVGPPMAGQLYDLTLRYDWTFAFCGVCLFISGLMMFAVPIIVNRNKET